jgi:glucokinase
LLGDIGATNARFALLASGTVGPVKSFDVARFARFADAVAIFLTDHCQQIEISKAVLAVAGPVEGGRCVLTNRSWEVDTRQLYEIFRLETQIINDFEAVAYSLPSLARPDLVGLGGVQPGAPMAVLGPGSGLGVACLVPSARKHIVISGRTCNASGCE